MGGIEESLNHHSQSESSATELLLENSILLAEVIDHRVLLASEPAGEGGNEKLPWLQNDGHPPIVAGWRGIRQLFITVPSGLFSPRIGSAE